MPVDPRTPEGVAKIAHLSRLALTDPEATAASEHMQKILKWVDELSELETDGVDAGLRDRATGTLRPDVARPSLSVEQALANAPKPDPLGFSVPAVLGE